MVLGEGLECVQTASGDQLRLPAFRERRAGTDLRNEERPGVGWQIYSGRISGQREKGL